MYLTEVTTMITQLAVGSLTGLLVGYAVFSHALSRAVVFGLLAGAILGAITVDGVEGYVRWATYLPTEMAKLSVFWIGLMAGILGGMALWVERKML
jgi:hypothetical protein